MSSYTRQQLEEWLKTIDVKAEKVLDVGGSQNPIKGRTKSFASRHYMILDLPEPHEQKAEAQIRCDLNDKMFFREDSSEIYKSAFDCVFCIEVAEYWWNPIQALQNINLFMMSGGVLYLSTHFIYPVHNPVEQDYLRYTRRGIEKLLEYTGFKIEEIIPRVEKENGASTLYGKERMRQAKGYEFHRELGHLIKAIKI